MRTGKQKVYLYPENQFRWGIGCGWDMRVQSVGSVGISLLNEPVRWVFHPTTIEDKRPLNEDDIQVLNHLRDLKEGLERERVMIHRNRMTDGERWAVLRSPELLKECKNASIRLCEAMEVSNEEMNQK